MSDQKTFRSEESRKNYEKNEKQRQQAQKRKVRQQKQGEMSEYAKAWLTEHPMKSLLTVAAVAVLCPQPLRPPPPSLEQPTASKQAVALPGASSSREPAGPPDHSQTLRGGR